MQLSRFQRWAIAGYAAVAVVLVIVVSSPKLRAYGNAPPARSKSGGTGAISVGDVATIYRDRGSVVILRTEAAWDEFMTLAAAGDDRGIAMMVLRGQAFLAESGTRVLIIDRAFERRRVRVLDGPTANQDGWVATIFLRTR